MQNTQLVSILIPAYNKAEWIADTIESALAQTWKHKEIIIVDDGSRDRTLEIARKFESPTVKVVVQENQGACAARNRAYSLAQGTYIQWLDADDLLHPEKIELQMQNVPDGADSLCIKTAAFGSFYFQPGRAQFRSTGLWQDLSPADWIVTKFTERAWMNPTSWLVSRKLSDLGGAWDVRVSPSGADDGEYICRVISRSERVEFVPRAACYYRIGNLSSLNHASGKALSSLALALTLCVEHLLSIENSQRTRKAGVQFLQDWFGFFYCGPTELVQQLQTFAASLGGRLEEPELGWRYAAIRRALGWRAANAASEYLRSRRMLAERAIDQFMKPFSADANVGKRSSVSSH